MLLWLSSRHLNLVSGGVYAGEGLKYLASEVAFEASEDVFGGQLFSGAAIAVVASSGAGRESGAGDDVQGAVGLAVPAAGKAMSSGLAAGGRDRRDAAQSGEGCLGADPVGVVAGGADTVSVGTLVTVDVVRELCRC
jgi:hypothetical protein